MSFEKNSAKANIINAIIENKLIAILRGIPKEKLIPLAEALYKGGIRLLEVTYSADKTVSDEETAENIKMLSKNFEGRMYIGAGTVLNVHQVKLTKKAGGKFIISPDTDEKVIKETIKNEMVSIPGALTPTEIKSAHNFGADFIKLFPISNLGAEYIKAIKAPLSHIKLLAVGGINEKNISDYLSTGICGFGLGSNITSKKLIENNDFDAITELAKIYVSEIKNG